MWCRGIGKGDVPTATACRWFERFRNKDYSLEDEQRSGRSSEIDLIELKQVIESDPNLSQRVVASKLGCTQRVIQYQFKQLSLVSKLGQWVPHDLTLDQKKTSWEVWPTLLPAPDFQMAWLFNHWWWKWCFYVNVKRRSQWLKPGQRPKPTSKAGLHPKKGCSVFGGV